ncbi:MAG TPA: hypothetical protein PKJ99_15335 [Thermoanaerobaculales bacterium]|nr:hypothetical protein [Thermoanaerobaculales bacterium]HPA79330.1 hypothetical protein [Thermoanaerobaculales bacterium]HQL30199.1 hypothetical protein [Thermoanaerobaculales bacterium]HQN96169.1 hypothetical protein [Thermoanaerobaculales bacterium]
MRRRNVCRAVAVAWVIAALASFPAAGSTFGVNAHIPSQPIQDEIVNAGIGWVRIDVVWGLIEVHRDTFDWTRYDALFDALEARGLRIFATLQGTPQWATSGSEFSGVPDEAADWQEFCYIVASRYRGRVDAWGFWNEPNLRRFWQGGRTRYIDEILLPGIAAVTTADPGALVVAPDLAHLSSGDWDDWLARVLGDAGHLLDVVSHHVYPSNGTVGDVTDKLAEDASYPWEPPSVRAVLDGGGWGDRPFWLTETGVESDAYGQTGQANFYHGLLEVWFGGTLGHDWIDRVFFYEMADPGDDPTLSWGILQQPPGLERKLAYLAYQSFTASALVDDAEIMADGLPPFTGSMAVIEPAFSVRNTGTTAWTAADGYRLTLRVDDVGWLVEAEPLPDGAVVAPGDTVVIHGWLRSRPVSPSLPPRLVAIEARMERAGDGPFGSGARELTVLVAREPPQLTRQPAAVVAPFNGTASFSVEATSPTAVAYQWRRNTAPIVDDHRHAGATTPVLSLSGIGFDSVGDYDCVVTNAAGPVASLPAALTLAGAPLRHARERLESERPALLRRWLEFRRPRPQPSLEALPPDRRRPEREPAGGR